MVHDDFRKAMPILFFFSLLGAFIMVIMPIYLQSIGLNGYQIGMLVALYVVTSIFVSFPIGEINDKWTVKLTIILGVLLFSVFLLGLGFFESFIILIPLFFIGGLGNNLGGVSIRTIVYKTRMKKEGKKFGLYSIISVAGHSAGVFAGAVLIFMLDFSLGLKIMGLLYLLLIPFASFKRHAEHKIRLIEYEGDLLNKRVILLGIIMFLFALHWGAESTSYGLFLKNNLGLDIFMIGVYSSISLLFLGVTSYVLGKRMDMKRMDMKNLFFIGMMISGIFHILHVIPIPWLSFVFRIFHEVGDGIAAIAVFFWISKIFSTKRIGGDSSMMFTIMLIGQVVGSLIFGPMGDYMGYHVPLMVSGVTSMLSAVLLLLFVKKFKIKTRY